MWKEQVDENKRKRKRDDDTGSDAKKAKADGSDSKSPSVKSPTKEDGKPESKKEKDGKEDGKEDKDGRETKSKTPETLVTIEHGRTKARTAKDDGVADSLRADTTEAAGEPVRDKCVVMIYDALASDSNACEWGVSWGAPTAVADSSHQDTVAVRDCDRARVLQAHELLDGQRLPRK